MVAQSELSRHQMAQASSPHRSGPLRVLQVAQRFFPEMGGVETHTYEVARRLAGAGVDVTVLTTDRSGKLPPLERVEGVLVRRVRAWPSQRDYYLAPGLFGAITAGTWDVVHCQGIHTFVPPVAMLAARQARIPYVVTFHTGGHTSRVRNAARKAQWLALRPLLAGASRLIGVSRFETGLFRGILGLPPERFLTIRNGAQLPQAAGAQQPRDPDLLLSVGRLERYKGHHRVIAALPLLLAQRPRLRLLILGTGPYEGALREQAAGLGVAEHVEIRSIPPGNREAMAAALDQAALMTLLSEYEAHPIAVMEAASRGCPALVADTSGLSELAAEGLARAVPLASSAATLAEAILAQLNVPLAPTGVALPTWEGCVAELLALYEQSAGRSQCAF